MLKRDFPPVASWDDFEFLCCDLWKAEWECKNMQANGRQGQEQQGVDCFGKMKNSKKWSGIQCKRKQTYPESNLTYAQVEKEVEDAKKFVPPLEQLIIATTMRRDPALQQKIRILSDELENEGLFSVKVEFWDDIEKLLTRHTDVAKEYYKEYFMTEEERKLFIAQNPTELALVNFTLDRWYGSPSQHLTFNVANVGKMPATNVSIRIFKSKEGDTELKTNQINRFCLWDNIKLDSNKNLEFPLIPLEDFVQQHSSMFTNKKIIGAGLDPSVPGELIDRINEETKEKLGNPQEYAFFNSFRNFPIYVNLTYKTPFGQTKKLQTGAYLYLQEV